MVGIRAAAANRPATAAPAAAGAFRPQRSSVRRLSAPVSGSSAIDAAARRYGGRCRWPEEADGRRDQHHGANRRTPDCIGSLRLTWRDQRQQSLLDHDAHGQPQSARPNLRAPPASVRGRNAAERHGAHHPPRTEQRRREIQHHRACRQRWKPDEGGLRHGHRSQQQADNRAPDGRAPQPRRDAFAEIGEGGRR